ncbi:MAG: CheR family methyltransferase [Polyangiales bacterium]
MSEPTLSPQVFSILSSLVEERVGLAYAPSDLELFASKACARALDAGFESMLDYYYHLRYDDPDRREFEALVEALLVHETFFFRELSPLEVMVDRFVAPRVAEGARPRVWCAACSTGEEPLTVAMLLAERGLLGRVELSASDLSEDTLARARTGRYSPRALRQNAGHPLAARWLRERAGALTVEPRLLEAIRFHRLNLADPSAVRGAGAADVIVCRNVLIYFRDALARQLVDGLTDLLPIGGVLVVGVSESLMRLSTRLRCEEHDGVFLYRRQA